MERLQKVMAAAGIASRRKCEEIIEAGRVKINGMVVTEPGSKVDPSQDIIEVDGQIIEKERPVYLLLNKPEGVITSVTDPQRRKTVIDLLGTMKERVYPVGRLDYDTSGLLLLTNDGAFANHITHPSHELDKVYEAEVKGHISEQTLERLRVGVELEDGITSPAQAAFIRFNRQRGTSVIHLTIHEGRNRQVRRMCDRVDHPVVTLRRIQLGFLTLQGVSPGQFRHLTPEEVGRLLSM
ncbi:pseudouridine synthase [Aneurinibacillus sp. Ricciae_BoGa-3]|uniref:pseudouridine synthase n=1 Tax=Aneurinibacillus sp. Ricciae_BoGa-3 TaxID=3022697 RepID=UPI00234124BB|nr:pseudouridine synthase [Aneurinibacillus sp. Ricciae_BoGa-3]WCK56018.1 pseudouridine synthase [Aneurinibacillus sp. Ricciae_BoGa-3]